MGILLLNSIFLKNSMKTIHIACLSLVVMLSSCKNEPQEEQFSAAEIQEHSAALNQYFEEQFQVEVSESPMMQTRMGLKTDYGQWDDFSHTRFAKELEQARTRLDHLEKVDTAALNEETRLSYDLYRKQIEDEIADYDFRFYNYPINQMHGYHAELPSFLINMHRIDSVPDAKAYISRLVGMEKALEDIVEGLRLREQNGIIPPKFVFDRTLDASRNLIKGKPFQKSSESSVLLEDFQKKVNKLAISEDQKPG